MLERKSFSESSEYCLSVVHSTDQTYNTIDWKTLFTWLWRWLPLRLSILRSPTTVLLRTTLTRTITLYELLTLLGSNHSLKNKLCYQPASLTVPSRFLVLCELGVNVPESLSEPLNLTRRQDLNSLSVEFLDIFEHHLILCLLRLDFLRLQGS